MHSCECNLTDADLAIFCDVCSYGMSFWIPSLHLTFQHAISAPPEQIFFFEALTIVSAICWFVDDIPVHPGSHLVVHTNNLNTVDMFKLNLLTTHYSLLWTSYLPFSLISKQSISLTLTMLLLMHSPGSITMLSLPWLPRPLSPPWTPSTYTGGWVIMTSAPHPSRWFWEATWTCEWLEHERALALGSAIKQSSAASYSSAFQYYLSFCQLHHFPIDLTLDTLSFYIVWMFPYITPKLVDSYLLGVAIQLEPFQPSVCQHCKHQLISCTLWGCKKLCMVPTTCKHALCWSELADLLPLYDSYSSSYDDLLFFTILFTGFHAPMCLSELVWPDKKVSMLTPFICYLVITSSPNTLNSGCNRIALCLPMTGSFVAFTSTSPPMFQATPCM